MKKLGIKLLLFITLFFVIDSLVGFVFDYMQEKTSNNKTGRMLHAPKDDLVVLGSSRSENHYNPQVFEDSLGLSSYNYGCPGNGIILMYGRMKLIAESHMPKIVIYDIMPQMDIEENDNSKYINTLKPLYNYAPIKDYIDGISPNEKYKMLSSMYRYNSNFMDVLKSYLTRDIEDPYKGFSPKSGTLKFDRNVNKSNRTAGEVDSLKYYYMESFIKEYKDKTNLIFIYSPRFKEYDNSGIELKELFNKYNVTYLDCQQLEPFCSCKEYWSDGLHMNEVGANEFSRYLSGIINNKFLSLNK